MDITAVTGSRLHYPLTSNRLKLHLLALLLCGLAGSCGAARLTYCNPVDIDYKYNFEQRVRKISYRSGADPVIVNHKGEYYLFATISGGWWHSKDLAHWRFVRPNIWPPEDNCAPAAVSAGDHVYIFQSTFDRRPIYRTSTPWNTTKRFRGSQFAGRSTYSAKWPRTVYSRPGAKPGSR